MKSTSPKSNNNISKGFDSDYSDFEEYDASVALPIFMINKLDKEIPKKLSTHELREFDEYLRRTVVSMNNNAEDFDEIIISLQHEIWGLLKNKKMAQNSDEREIHENQLFRTERLLLAFHEVKSSLCKNKNRLNKK
jgi:hypothetical protein